MQLFCAHMHMQALDVQDEVGLSLAIELRQHSVRGAGLCCTALSSTGPSTATAATAPSAGCLARHAWISEPQSPMCNMARVTDTDCDVHSQAAVCSGKGDMCVCVWILMLIPMVVHVRDDNDGDEDEEVEGR